MSDLKSAVWYITHVCNNKCPYCHFVQDPESAPIEPFIDSARWVEAWNKLKPERLDITGGEPFLQPKFFDLLNGLDSSIKIAITTSLQQIPSENSYALFGQRISPEKVDTMTLSYHPTMQDWDDWKGKALWLKNRGFYLTCNFVGFPEQEWLIEEIKQRCADMGIRFHLDPYYPPSKIPYTPNKEEKQNLMRFTEKDRTLTLNEADVPHKPCYCDAGKNHIQVNPRGDAFRCGTLSDTEGGKMGNILDPDFRLYTDEEITKYPCEIPWRCQSCDRDKTQKSWRFLE